jgi:Ca2+-binding EF-hand superfamily protein
MKKKATKAPAPKVKLTMDKIFNLLDIDNDGKINSSELGTALHSCGYPIDKIEVEGYKNVLE